MIHENKAPKHYDSLLHNKNVSKQSDYYLSRNSHRNIYFLVDVHFGSIFSSFPLSIHQKGLINSYSWLNIKISLPVLASLPLAVPTLSLRTIQPLAAHFDACSLHF